MNSPPKLFDLDALAQHRERADGSAWFLHDNAIAEIQERLKDINRQFISVAIVGWRAKEWAHALGIDAHCVPDADTLDLSESTYDLIIHAMGLHWANDPIGQLVQMRRALQPDGLMLAAMLGGQTLSELRIAIAYAETNVFSGMSPRISPMGEVRELGGLLQRAGLALPVADNYSLKVSYENPIRLMHDLRAMGETNALAARSKRHLSLDFISTLTSYYMEKFGDADDRITATYELIFLTGWAPSDSQQKPLKPGSAQSRLSDALGVPEKNPEKD